MDIADVLLAARPEVAATVDAIWMPERGTAVARNWSAAPLWHIVRRPASVFEPVRLGGERPLKTAAGRVVTGVDTALSATMAADAASAALAAGCHRA